MKFKACLDSMLFQIEDQDKIFLILFFILLYRRNFVSDHTKINCDHTFFNIEHTYVYFKYSVIRNEKPPQSEDHGG